ncbi:MAG: hypothetical protein Q8P90_03055 [bacterium]|nr:hypothetical protein [bacterium]
MSTYLSKININLILVVTFIITTVLFAGCTTKTPEVSNDTSTNVVSDVEDNDVADDAMEIDVADEEDVDAEEISITAEPGESPFDFPTVATTAEAGDYVLTPSRVWLDDAFAEGPDNVTFIFYSATMEEPGDVESKVSSVGTPFTMPNSMIIPLESGQTAEPGDVLLSWWQSGSGMMRAYVVEGGTTESPMVRYLDLDLDNPATNDDGSPIAEREEQLEVNSFHILEGEYAPGSSVAVKNGSEYDHYQVVSEADGKLLVIGFAGRMNVVEKADSVAMPIIPDVAVGDSVMVPLYGSYDPGTVTSIDDAVGRVFVEYEFAGQTEEAGYAYGDVISSADLQ